MEIEIEASQQWFHAQSAAESLMTISMRQAACSKSKVSLHSRLYSTRVSYLKEIGPIVHVKLLESLKSEHRDREYRIDRMTSDISAGPLSQKLLGPHLKSLHERFESNKAILAAVEAVLTPSRRVERNWPNNGFDSLLYRYGKCNECLWHDYWRIEWHSSCSCFKSAIKLSSLRLALSATCSICDANLNTALSIFVWGDARVQRAWRFKQREVWKKSIYLGFVLKMCCYHFCSNDDGVGNGTHSS